jgi:hypothetical protein
MPDKLGHILDCGCEGDFIVFRRWPGLDAIALFFNKGCLNTKEIIYNFNYLKIIFQKI